MKNKLLRTRLFGFSKTDVCEYVTRVNDEFNEKLALVNSEHQSEKKDLEAKITSLTEEIDRYKQTNADIARALFDAQKYAAELKAQSDAEYQKAMEEIAELKDAETLKLTEYRGKIEETRKSIAVLLAEINGKLSEAELQTSDLISQYNSEDGIVI